MLCQSYHWQCRTNRQTGEGRCAGFGQTYADAYYCGATKKNNCNNFGSIDTNSGVAWTCWDPSISQSINCTSSGWQCETDPTLGIGKCGREPADYAFTCVSSRDCNMITSCYDHIKMTSNTCSSPRTTRACTNSQYGSIFRSTRVSGCVEQCSESPGYLFGLSNLCCYHSNCNSLFQFSASSIVEVNYGVLVLLSFVLNIF